MNWRKQLTEQNKAIVVTSLIAGAILTLGQIFDVWERVYVFFVDKPIIKIVESTRVNKKDVERLKTIGQQDTFKYDESNYQHYEKLRDYYFAANKEFMYMIDSLDTIRITNKTHQGITYFVAPPGAGKSFFARYLNSKKGILYHKVKLSDIADRNNLNSDYFELKPDLQNSNSTCDYTFSKQPSLKQGIQFDINTLFNWADINIVDTLSNFIVIDDIDEMHPNFSTLILKNITNHINTIKFGERPKVFMHFFVFGRPEAFRQYLMDTHRPPVEIDFYEMRPPVYKTKGDILLIVSDYNKYSSEGAVPVEETVLAFNKLITQYSFLLSTIRNLSQSNFLVQEISKRKAYTEKELKVRIYGGMLDRNSLTHGRPNKDNEFYKAIIRGIACKYACKVDNHGFFEVRADDKIKIERLIGNELCLISVDVNDALDRSGLIYLRPTGFVNTYYRFEPHWLHSLLVSESK